MDLDEFMRERVFKPLDMRDTSFRMTAAVKDRFVQLYQKTEDKTGIEPAPDSRSERYFDSDSRWFSGGGGPGIHNPGLLAVLSDAAQRRGAGRQAHP